MTRFFLFFGLVTIPFSGIAGLGFLGELATELSTYFFLPAVLAAGLSFANQKLDPAQHNVGQGPSKFLVRIAMLSIAAIALSFVFNANAIGSGSTQGRLAVEKWATSLLVIVYSFGLSYVVLVEASRNWHALIIKPIAISAGLCIAFSIFEILSRRFGLANGIYVTLDRIVHAGWNPAVYMQGWDERLRSVSFEAPAFGNYVGYAWPWLLVGWLVNRGKSRSVYFTVWFLLTALQVYSPSRTVMVTIGGCLVVMAFLRFVYLPPRLEAASQTLRRFSTGLLVALALVAALVGFTFFSSYEASVIASSSVSDLTRLAYIETAFRIFMDYPLFGTGLGQFAFRLFEYLPNWAYLSSEVATWASSKPPVHYWPATYTVYGRLACELGLAGLIGWIVLWLGLARSIVCLSRDYQRSRGSLPAIAYPLVASCFCVLLSGLSTDTFRTPMIWITLGLTCRYLVEVRESLRPHRVLARGLDPNWSDEVVAAAKQRPSAA